MENQEIELTENNDENIDFANKESMSYQEIQKLVQTELDKTKPNTGKYISYWIKELYPDYVIYKVWDDTRAENEKVYKLPYSIDSNKNVKLEQAKKQEVYLKTSYEPVINMSEFAMFSEDDDYRVIRGKIFEAGEYPDKGISFTELDLEQIVKNFSEPVDIDLSHVATPLDGKLGKLTSIWKIGKEVHGEAKIPKWLDKSVPEKRVSCTFNRENKQKLAKLAMVINPRVKDAAMFQQVLFSDYVEFYGARNNVVDAETIQNIHDSCCELGAKCNHKKGDTNMSEKEAVITQPEKVDFDAKLAEFKAEMEAKFSADLEARTKEVEANADTRLKAVEAENKKLRDEKRHNTAVTFAENLVHEGKATPAEVEKIAKSIEKALKDDEIVGFEEGESRFEELKAMFEARPVRDELFSEAVIETESGKVIFNKDKQEGVSKDRVKELLGKSSIGQGVLNGGN